MLPRLQAIRSSKKLLELQPGLSYVGWKILVTGLAFEAPPSCRVSSPHGEGLTLWWNVLLPPSVRRGEEGRARGRVGLSAPTTRAAPEEGRTSSDSSDEGVIQKRRSPRGRRCGVYRGLRVRLRNV